MTRSRVLTIALLIVTFATSGSAQTRWLDQFLERYKPPKVDPAASVTPQVSDEPWRLMVNQGVLPLSVNDVIRLMLASNLDVTVNRFSPLANQYVLQTLFQPFEPTLNISAQAARNTTPPTSQLQVGTGGAVPFSQLSHRYSVGYGQTLQSGTILGVNAVVNRNSSNSLFNTFNPAYFGTLTYSVSQPFFRNYGRAINGWQIRIGKNNVNISEIGFEMQTIDLVTAAENLYWDFVYQREDIKVHQQALALSEKTLADNKRQVQIGTMARIEVVQAESEVAQRQFQMVTTTYTADQTQDQVKKLITNLGDPALVLAQLSPLNPLPQPDESDIMPLEESVKYALESRPELRQLALQEQNGEVAMQYAKNQLLPALIVGASYTQNGVGGVQTNRSGLGGSQVSVIQGGLVDAFGQLFGYNYTGYTVGFNIAIPLSNKAEQAIYAKALSDKQVVAARRTQVLQQIALEVRNAHSVVVMNRARIQTAEKALELAMMQSEAEQKKFQLGNSQLRFVLQEQRNVTDAQTARNLALVSYAKALVTYDKAIGRTLRKNNVEIEKQLQVAGKL